MTVIGSYAIRNNIADVVVMIVLGVFGWGLGRFGFAVSPIVLGLILGAIAEQGFVQAWTIGAAVDNLPGMFRSEEHTSELQSLMRISYAVFCLKKKTDPHVPSLSTSTNKPQTNHHLPRLTPHIASNHT